MFAVWSSGSLFSSHVRCVKFWVSFLVPCSLCEVLGLFSRPMFSVWSSVSLFSFHVLCVKFWVSFLVSCSLCEVLGLFSRFMFAVWSSGSLFSFHVRCVKFWVSFFRLTFACAVQATHNMLNKWMNKQASRKCVYVSICTHSYCLLGDMFMAEYYLFCVFVFIILRFSLLKCMFLSRSLHSAVDFNSGLRMTLYKNHISPVRTTDNSVVSVPFCLKKYTPTDNYQKTWYALQQTGIASNSNKARLVPSSCTEQVDELMLNVLRCHETY